MADFRKTICGLLVLGQILTGDGVNSMEIKKINTADLPPDGGKHYNRLIFEKSPYLLQHAENPIDWYPWSEEALNRALAENKPIFLSIGYATCHWCHVMARESFADLEVAELLNRHFISIKVDREERPDLDAIYMKISQAVTGSGGWPLNVILTPDGKPFLVGTYFPKENNYGRPGLMEILTKTAELWEKDRQKLVASANRVVELVGEENRSVTGAEPADPQLFATAFSQLSASYDRENGGFGRAPKFPVPHQYFFLLRHWRRTGDELARQMAVNTLTAICRGGIYDHLGFGFHRYSTDQNFLLPHFEKMLYDQALLALAYLEAWQASGEPLLAETAREIFTYVSRDLTDPEGGFYSAEDADSEGEEGLFYLWSEKEIIEILGREAGGRFNARFQVKAAGNFKDEASGSQKSLNILHLDRQDTDIAAMAEQRLLLLEKRSRRIRPQLDDKIITAWNGLMIAALARGGRVLDDPKLTAMAERAAGFILTRMQDDRGRLLRSYRQGAARIAAFQDDYAYLVWGLLELFETTYEGRYLEEASSLNRTMLSLFGDRDSGALNFSGRENESLVMQVRDFYDGALPSGNSVALYNLARLSALLDDRELAKRAAKLAAACGAAAGEYPAGHTMFLSGLDFLNGPIGEIVVAGKKDEPMVGQALKLVNSAYTPNHLVIFSEEGINGVELGKMIPWLEGKTSTGSPVTIYFCQDYSCQKPITELDDLRAELNKLSTPKRP